MPPELWNSHSHRDFNIYCASLEAGLAEKLKLITPWLSRNTAGNILDIGCGTGSLAAEIAKTLPNRQVLGLDISSIMQNISRKRHGGPGNLTFHEANACEPYPDNISNIVMCSVLHEVYSYLGGMPAIQKAIKQAWKSLNPGGRLIIRDFVKPEQNDRPVFFRHNRSDICTRRDFISFSRSSPYDVALYSAQTSKWHITYETDFASIYEFVLRKNYQEMWNAELIENYGFWTTSEAQDILVLAGFKIIHKKLIKNQWIAMNNMHGKVEICGSNLISRTKFDPNQILLVAEKPILVV